MQTISYKIPVYRHYKSKHFLTQLCANFSFKKRRLSIDARPTAHLGNSKNLHKYIIHIMYNQRALSKELLLKCFIDYALPNNLYYGIYGPWTVYI